MLFVVLLVCSVVNLPAESNDMNDIGYPLLGDGQHAVVPIEDLRNALWYYDSYFIQKDRADALDVLLAETVDDYGECTEDLELCENAIAWLQGDLDDTTSSRNFWRAASLTTWGGILTALLASLIF